MTPFSQSKLGLLLKNNWPAIKSKSKGALVGAALSAAGGFILLTTGLGDVLVARSYDIPFSFRPMIGPEEVVMVYLDDDSNERLNQSYANWDRSLHARLLKRLTAEKAKAVVFDIIFSDLRNPVADQEFAEAIKENGKVILSADFIKKGYGIGGAAMQGFKRSNPLFTDAAADHGSTMLFPEFDMAIRRYNPANKDDQLASEAWAAAVLIGADVTKDERAHFTPFWMNHYGPITVFRGVSFYKAIEESPDVPRGFFSNKVVFVGGNLQTKDGDARKDEYATPFSMRDKDLFMPGVAIHATAFLNLIRGDWLNRFPYLTERTIILCLGILFGAGLVFLRPIPATFIALACIIPIGLGNYFLFTNCHYWFPWLVIIVGQIPIALMWSISFNSLQIYRQKILVEQSLALYLSPKLVKKFAKEPKLLKPGAEKQMLTIFFSDIAGFTTISEGMDSDHLAKLMNNYFQNAVGHCIHHTEGTVVKYIGDAIFAFWNAPDPQNDHQYRAAEAALRFRDLAAQEINGQVLVTRIGLHTGVANVGNFGSTTRIDYTAIGENINLASRMEGLNKYLGTRVLLTAETQQGIGPRLVTRYLGQFRLKGFERAVGVYELVGRPEEEATTREWRQYFDVALERFQNREFDEAAAGFNCVLEIRPDDPPTKFYLRQIEEFRFFPIPEGWKGEIELQEK